MIRKMPQVREYMTPMPHTIGAEQPLKKVQEMMQELRVRHLPVKKGGKLIGLISDRNVKEALVFSDKMQLTVEDVMISNPYHIPPEMNLSEVVAAMAEEKFGCAIIQEEEGNLIGIFTTVDACRALRQVLETIYPEY